MTHIRSSLQSRLSNTPWDEDELRRKAAGLWHATKGETVMVRLAWLKNDIDRQFTAMIGEKMYGKVNSDGAS